MISIIVAIANNYAIGNKGELLYHIPADLKRFRVLTSGHTVIMGRKTFESLPKGALPNRRNIVLTRNSELQFEGAETYSSMEEAIAHSSEDEQIFIIGGAEIYRQALPVADRLELTRIYAPPAEADTFFPIIDYSEWEEIANETHKVTDGIYYGYSFITLRRKQLKFHM